MSTQEHSLLSDIALRVAIRPDVVATEGLAFVLARVAPSTCRSRPV